MTEQELIRKAASLWGRLGGSVSSPVKAAAARKNGKKGGRPGCNGCSAYTGNWPCKCGHTKADCPYRPSRLRCEPSEAGESKAKPQRQLQRRPRRGRPLDA